VWPCWNWPPRCGPNLVLMDIAMPGLNGLETTARLLKAQPDVRVLILSMHQNEEYVRRALRHGAVAYLLKDAAPLELELALTAVMRGETYLSPAVSKGVVNDYVQRLRGDDPSGEALSPRQREVLQLIAEGHSTKEIARRLDLSVKTVETHRSQLMKLLDIHEVAGPGALRHAGWAGVALIQAPKSGGDKPLFDRKLRCFTRCTQVFA
jgi:DNA-binding NarL/FixJ family response regulator